MSTVEEKFKYLTPEENIVIKDWAAGSSEPTDMTEYVITDGDLVHATIRYPPALIKCVDELIVNALDHMVASNASNANNASNSTPVTTIQIDFAQDGSIRVYNDGPGIPIEVHRDASKALGKTIYVPSMVFGVLFQGSNHVKSDSITGGVNGMGAKIVACFSSMFAAETVDHAHYFCQIWRDMKKVEEPPKIIPIAQIKDKTLARQHTCVKFLPQYTHFGYSNHLTSDQHALLDRIIRTRAHMAAAYCAHVGNTKVTYNGAVIKCGPANIIEMMARPAPEPPTARKATAKASTTAHNVVHFHAALGTTYPWDLRVAVGRFGDLRQCSNVNGIVVNHGKHFNHILSRIVAAVKEMVNVTCTARTVAPYLCMFINAQVPGPRWTGQRKDVLDTDIRKFAEYVIPAPILTRMAKAIAALMLEDLSRKAPVARKVAVKSAKYQKAKYAGTKQSLKCTLLPVEGDSAMTQVIKGVANSAGFDYYGVICLGGVIANIRKKCIVTRNGNRNYIVKGNKVFSNAYIKLFLDASGLNPECTYDPEGPNYKREMASLNYGSIAMCVDQDLDGKGKILGLLASMIEYIWPQLARSGYVRWISTPVKRAYPKARGHVVHEFHNDIEYHKWAKTQPAGSYELRYYKGLGSHNDSETEHMFRDIQKKIYTYEADESTRAMFDIYFGRDPDSRKVQLSAVPPVPSEETLMAQTESRMIKFSDHLLYETDPYQRDDLDRKLDHVIDGQNQAGRKILYAVLKHFKKKNTPYKIASLAGKVSAITNYHHGEDGLASSVIGRGYVFTGGRQLPFLCPGSQFGSRLLGGKDAASPRYIYAKLNAQMTDLLFPVDDFWLLEFGEDVEPKYYVPILPMAVLESNSLPSHGWKMETWARDVYEVIKYVTALIDSPFASPGAQGLPPCYYAGAPYEWKGRFVSVCNVIYSVGTYTLSGDEITITELPLKEWTIPYVDKLYARAEADTRIIRDIDFAAHDKLVKIRITLQPGAMALLDAEYATQHFDGIEVYFSLRKAMHNHINLMMPDKSIKIFSRYDQVVDYWFEYRRKMYGERVRRNMILYGLRVRMQENIVRYLQDTNLRLGKLPLREMNERLLAAAYDRFDAAFLLAPKREPTDFLRAKICEGHGASYKYLLKLSDYKKSAESIAEAQNRLDLMRREMDEYDALSRQGRFIGAVMWKNELEKLTAVIREGLSTRWEYSEYNKYTYA